MVSPIALYRAVPGDRLRDLGMLAGLTAWLVYTRFYWTLHATHVALPPCPFYYLTGHPCPFCGGTRSFAYMWQGDLTDAVRLYPLGPLFFVGSLIGAGGLASGVITAGGTLGILIPPSVMIIVYAAVAGQSVVKLYAAIEEVLRSEDTKKNLDQQGATPLYKSTAEFGAYIKGEMTKWGPVVQKAGMKPE